MKSSALLSILAGVLSGVVSSWVIAETNHGSRGGGATASLLPDGAAAAGAGAHAPADFDAGWIRHEEKVTAHWREPVDSAWAEGAKGAFTNDFATLASRVRFTVERLDCRSTSCVADLRFSDYASMTATWRSLLDFQYTENCRKEFMAPEPADRSASYRTTMIFDCRDSP